MAKRWLIRIGVLLLVSLAIVLLRQTLLTPKPIPVKTYVVDRGRVESSVTNSKAGTVKARLRAQLAPETGGRVIEIPHRRGSLVKPGDLLIQLNDASQRALLAQANANLAAADAAHREACLRADRAASELERNRKLAQQKVISEDQLEQLQSNFDASRQSCELTKAQIEQARAAVRVAEAELAKMTIRAPFEGVIAELTAELGEWINPAPAMVVVPATIDLINTASIYISAPMDEVDSGAMAVGQIARITMDPFPGRHFTGRLTRMAPFVLDVEAQNRTVEIEVELDDKAFSASLLPGTSADVEVILSVQEKAIRIPTSCLIQGAQVLVVKSGVLESRQVKVGLRNWAYCEILEGLSEGEKIVTSLDRAEIKPGAQVSLLDEGSPR